MIVGLMPHSDLLFPDLPPELFVHGQPQTSGVGRLALLPEDAGQVVEQGPVSDILCHPVHEYTRGLLGSVLSIEAGGSRLHQVPGSVPSPKDFPEGDRFTPRSSHPDKVSQLRPVLKRVSDSDHYYAELPDSELKRLGIKPYVPGGAII